METRIEHSATREDLANLRTLMAEEFAKVHVAIQDLRGEMYKREHKLYAWMIGTTVTLAGFMIAGFVFIGQVLVHLPPPPPAQAPQAAVAAPPVVIYTVPPPVVPDNKK